MSIETEIIYQGGLHCLATHAPSKAALVTDAPLDNGGKGEAFSPTDLLSAALGTCLLTIMGLVAQRSKFDITGAKVRVVKEMAADPARRIGRFDVTVTMPKGRVYSEADRRRLERGAAGCPVKQSLHPDVEMNVSFVWSG